MSGFICLMVSAFALWQLPDKDQNTLEQQDATDTFIGGIALGVPLVAGRGYMLWGLRRRNEKLLRDRLDSTFDEILKADNGRITVLHNYLGNKLNNIWIKKLRNSTVLLKPAIEATLVTCFILKI